MRRVALSAPEASLLAAMGAFQLGRASMGALGASQDGGVDLSWLTVALLPLAIYQRGEGLDHPTRRRIYQHLLVLPGDHFRSIMRSLQLGLGTCRYHLDVLVAQGHALRVKAGGRCRYYPRGELAEPQLNRLYANHWAYRDSRLRILFALSRLHDCRASAIARSLGMSRQLVAYHLARLEDAGYVRREGREYVPLGLSEAILRESSSAVRTARADGASGSGGRRRR